MNSTERINAHVELTQEIAQLRKNLECWNGSQETMRKFGYSAKEAARWAKRLPVAEAEAAAILKGGE